MSFPNISFKHTNTEVNYKLQDLITEKLKTLGRYIGDKSDNHCEVEFEKIAPHQNGNIYRVEVNLWSDGVMYRSENVASTFENAIDTAQADLESTLNKARTKRSSLWRKGSRKIKEMMRWGS